MNRTSLAVLSVLALLAAALLSALHGLSEAPIEAQRQVAAERSLLDLLPSAMYDNHPLARPIELAAGGLLENTAPAQAFLATLEGRPSAVIVPVSGRGYVGEIRLLVAISPEGRLISSKVLQQDETPGLGQLIERSRSPWLGQFDNLTLDAPAPRWLLRDEGGAVDQISGATVSSRAARDALQRSLRFFDAQRARLLQEDAP